jgi:hypothetical protein
MKILVRSGLVLSEKSGRWVYYRIHRAAFAEAIRHLGKFAGEPASAPVRRVGRRPTVTVN